MSDTRLWNPVTGWMEARCDPDGFLLTKPASSLVSPAAQNSTAAYAVLAGSELDTRGYNSLAYTLKDATQTITFEVFGANLSDYSDEVIVSGPTDILATGSASYAVTPAPYAYYRVKIIDKVGGTHGVVTLSGIAKG